MVHEWKDLNGNVLRVTEYDDPKRLKFQLISKGAVITFWFDTKGDYGDFVSVLITLAKETFDIDFQRILNSPIAEATQ